MSNVNELIGKTLVECSESGDSMCFETTTGEKYQMYHSQDCCESVRIEDICGDLNDLIGSPITIAEESTGDTPAGCEQPYDSYTWTFYRFATVKGYVNIRWLGESNGYYSESVNFEKMS